MIKFRCEACNKKIGAPANKAGKQVICPACKQKIAVPNMLAEPDPTPLAASAATDPASSGAAEPDPLMPDLDELEPSQHTTPRASGEGAEATCPSCQNPVNSTAALCIHCGEPLQPGVARQTTRITSADHSPRGRRLAGSAAGLVVAGIVAGVFSLVWVGLVVFTGYEFGALAWGLGGLIGLTAGAIAKNPSPIFGGLTAGLAASSILAAKLLMAALIFFTAMGLSFLGNANLYSPQGQKIYHAVLDEMIAEDAFTDEQRDVAQASVAAFFSGDETPDGMEDNWEQWWEASQAVEAAALERMEAMSEEEQLAAVERARARYPYWIEDDNLYLAVLDDLVANDELPANLERHARSELVALDGGDYDREYHETTSLREQQERGRALRERAGQRIEPLSSEQRQAIIESARERHPRWIVDERLHYAVLSQMVAGAEFTDAVQAVAKAEVATNMDYDWDQSVHDQYDAERLMDLRGQATAEVNHRIQRMSEQERADAIAAAEAAHPAWAHPLGFDADEIQDAFQQEGVDGSFSSALRASFGFLDVLWFVLALSTAYSVAIKQGE